MDTDTVPSRVTFPQPTTSTAAAAIVGEKQCRQEAMLRFDPKKKRGEQKPVEKAHLRSALEKQLRVRIVQHRFKALVQGYLPTLSLFGDSSAIAYRLETTVHRLDDAVVVEVGTSPARCGRGGRLGGGRKIEVWVDAASVVGCSLCSMLLSTLASPLLGLGWTGTSARMLVGGGGAKFGGLGEICHRHQHQRRRARGDVNRLPSFTCRRDKERRRVSLKASITHRCMSVRFSLLCSFQSLSKRACIRHGSGS